GHRVHRALPAFPTRRSSDLSGTSPVNCLVTNAVYSHSGQHVLIPAGARILGETRPVQALGETRLAVGFHRLLMPDGSTLRLDQRSEEHTSELQSRENLVCRL